MPPIKKSNKKVRKGSGIARRVSAHQFKPENANPDVFCMLTPVVKCPFHLETVHADNAINDTVYCQCNAEDADRRPNHVGIKRALACLTRKRAAYMEEQEKTAPPGP